MSRTKLVLLGTGTPNAEAQGSGPSSAVIVDDKARFAAWSARDDIKAELKVNIILKMAEYHYPPVTLDDVYKEVLEQAENFRKYAE